MYATPSVFQEVAKWSCGGTKFVKPGADKKPVGYSSCVKSCLYSKGKELTKSGGMLQRTVMSESCSSTYTVRSFIRAFKHHSGMEAQLASSI